jgi:hypothetical protein
MISRLRRLIFPEPEVHVTARQVEGPSLARGDKDHC